MPDSMNEKPGPGLTVKRVLKVILFSVVCILMIFRLQSVLAYNWSASDFTGTRYEAFREEPAGTIDVVMIGSSGIHAALSPAILWNEAGITSFNFGSDNNVSLLYYYQLQYIFKIQKPKLVLIDASGLSFEKNLRSKEEMYEYVYRRAIDTMPVWEWKWEMIRHVTSMYPSQDILTYLFPLLRYHDRWSSLETTDFVRSLADKEYKSCSKGCNMSEEMKHLNWDMTMYTYRKKGFDLYKEYLQKTIDLCKANDVDVMLMLMPKFRTPHADFDIAREYAAKNDLRVLAMETREDFDRAGLDVYTDFYNAHHLNILGQKKFSEYVAPFLTEYYDLPDHRSDPAYSSWTDALQKYMKLYEKYRKRMMKKISG